MADNFTAEAVSSSGEIFATDQNAGDSAHYPVGKLAWGPLNTFNLTDTANPFPVQLIEGSFAGPVFSHGDSAATPSGVALVYESDTGANVFSVVGQGTPLPVQMVTDPVNVLVTDIDTAAFSGIIQNIAYSSAANGYDATNSGLRVSLAAGLNDSSSPVFVDNNSAHPVFVRGVTDSTVPVSGTVSISGSVATSTNITVTNAPDTTVTVTASTITGITTAGNDGGALDSTNSAIRVNVVAGSAGGDSTVTATISGTPGVAPAASTALGGAQAFAATISSAATLVSGTPTRLYSYHVFNPDTAADVFLKVYNDTAVTLGTDSAVMDLGIPFGGGAVLNFPVGVNFSNGISLAVAGGAGSTNHTAPSTSLVVTVTYA